MPIHNHTTGSYDNVEELVDAAAVWRGFVRQLPLFLGIAAAVFLTSVAYIFLAKTYYTAETSLVIESHPRAVITQDDAFSRDGLRVDTEVELLRSRAMAIRVARRLLQQSSGVAGEADEDAFDLVEISDSGQSNSASHQNTNDAAAEGAGETPSSHKSEARSIEKVLADWEAAFGGLGDRKILRVQATDETDAVGSSFVNNIRSHVVIEQVESTSLVLIRFRDPSPERAAFVANAYAAEYMLEQLESQFKTLRQAGQWIDSRLEGLREDVRLSEEAAALFRAEHGLVDTAGTNVTAQRIQDLAAELAKQRNELSAVIVRYDAVNKVKRKEAPLETIDEVMLSDVIKEMRRQQTTVVRRRGELRSRYGEMHPQMKQVRQEEADLQRQIDGEIARIVQNLRSESELAKSRVRKLEQDISALQSQIATDNPAIVRLRELEREATASRTLYETLLDRQKELNERERLAEPDARIITRAVPPESPSDPKRAQILGSGAILALLLGGIAAYISELVDSRIKNTSDLRRVFGSTLPVVLVPSIGRRKLFGAKDVDEIAEQYIRDKPSSSFADSFREIRTILQLAKDADKKRSPVSIAFTSAESGEGKTTMAFGFATLLASEGERVVYINADRNLSNKGTFFGAPKPGIFESSFKLLTGNKNNNDGNDDYETERLQEEFGEMTGHDEMRSQELVVDDFGKSPAEVVNTINGVDVALMASGGRAGEEYWEGEALDSYFSQLGGQYDYIVLDTAALFHDAEAAYVAAHADYTALITQWRTSTRDSVRVACQQLLEARAEILCVIISQVDERQKSYFRPEDRKFYFKKR